MSLQYIIDGCNVINHPLFIRNNRKKHKDARVDLEGFVRQNSLCGSPNNGTIIVFDGYPSDSFPPLKPKGASLIFSGEDSADAVIKRMLEKAGNQKNVRVVSDDKELILFARFSGAVAVSVEEFINRGHKTVKKTSRPLIEQKEELGQGEIYSINKELERLWLNS